MTRPRFMEQCYEPGEKWPKPIFANKDRKLNFLLLQEEILSLWYN